MRERCCDPTNEKFVSLRAQLEDAIREGVNEAPEVPVQEQFDTAQLLTGLEAMGEMLADRVQIAVSEAFAERDGGAVH